MKRFIISVLCVSVFFVGLGNLIERASASFKSDDKALELLRKTRAAIGGDSAVGGVRSMTILGKATKTLDLEGVAKTENGDFEINFELPNKMSRKMKFGSGEGDQLVDRRVDVVVVSKIDGDNLRYKTVDPAKSDAVGKVTIVKKDGTSEEVKIDSREPLMVRKIDGDATWTSEDGKTATVDGKKVLIRRADAIGGKAEFSRSNELLRTTLSLLATAPEGLDVTYTYAGEGTVDGASCDIIAASDGASTIKLYLDKSTSLPRMVSYQGHKPFMIRFNKGDVKPGDETKTFERQLPEPEMAEFQIKFSDFRSVGSLQLPHKWTQTIAGKDDEVLEITSYELNPANIGDKFKEEPTRVFVRTKQ